MDFQLTADGPPVKHREGSLFERPSRAQKCRQAIWQTLSEFPSETISILDLVRDLDFPKSDIYHAAKTLVRVGLAQRREVSWHELLPSGKERMHRLVGVRFVRPWHEFASRKW